MTRARACAFALSALAALGGCARPRVARVSDGVTRVSAYVPDTAYAATLAGVLAEERGDVASARRFYDEAYADTGDPWLHARREGLGKKSALGPQGSRDDVLTELMRRPPTDGALLDGAEAVIERDAPLAAWLVERAIASMAKSERTVTTPRASRLIARLYRSSLAAWAQRLAAALVLRVPGPYAENADAWLVERLAVDGVFAAAPEAPPENVRAATLALLHRRTRLSFGELAGRARVAHREDWAQAAGDRPDPFTAASWMAFGTQLCLTDPEAFGEWLKAKPLAELTSDPLYPLFARETPCLDATRKAP